MEAHALRVDGRGGHAKAGRLRRIASDDRLVDLVRAGDDGAFEVLFERYERPILSFCRHMLGSREEAEDAAQQAFLSAYNGIHASERHIQLRPWLYTIARNHCLSQLRARREQASLEDVEPSVEGLAAEVQRRADLRDMLNDLARLPEDQRAALVLAELGDLSHEEIADVVGCPKGKVKALVFQARSSLATSRQARDTSCQEIREQLATLTGGSLRRTTLRRHLRECPGCRAFRDEVKQQRAAMAVLLPVLPTAGLKAGVLSGIGASKLSTAVAAGGAAGGTAGITAGGGLVTALASGGVAKMAAVALVAAGGLGGVAAVRAVEDRPETTPVVTPAASSSAAKTRAAFDANPSSTFEPVRAHGAHAPGKQSGGVANGKNPKGEHGRSGTAPGRAKTSPGRAGTSPGRAKTTPGRSGTAPGRAKSETKGSIDRGRSEAAPGRANSPSAGGGSTETSGGGSTEVTAPSRGNSNVVDDVTRVVPKAK